MENSNSVQLTINLDTENGKALFAAIVGVMSATPTQVGILSVDPAATKKVAAPKAPAPDTAKVIPFPPVAAPAIPAAQAPAPTAPVQALPSAPAPTPPSAPAPAAPSLPSAPKAPVAPAAPSLPAAPAATKKVAAPKAPAAPVVPFESLDEDGKREAIKKLTTKWSKKGKTTDVKALFAAYGAANVESVDATYLDHFNWAMTTFDTNGQDMAAVLSTFGAQ